MTPSSANSVEYGMSSPEPRRRISSATSRGVRSMWLLRLESERCPRLEHTERSPRLARRDGRPVAERPLRADARRNRERVLEAARELFAAQGGAVPLDEIAAR